MPQLALGSSMIMLGNVRDDDYGKMVGGPGHGGKSTYVAVDDTDAVYARAKAAGARILEEPTDRDYGSRDFICADPEGNVWSFGTYWPKADDPQGMISQRCRRLRSSISAPTDRRARGRAQPAAPGRCAWRG